MRDLEARNAEKKYDLYKPFLSAIGDMLTPSRQAAARNTMEAALIDFQSFVPIWGSDEVVEAFYRFRRASSTEDPPPPQILVRLVADIYLAVRRDVAWPDTTVTGVHTIGVRINDLTPELEADLSMPFSELVRKHDWKPPFPV